MSSSSTPTARSGFAATLIAATLGPRPTVAVPLPLVHLLGDWTAAAFLSQCSYWTDRTADPHGWFHKTHDAWKRELCLSPDQIRRCVRTCAGLIEVRRKGIPARNYYRVNRAVLEARLLELRASEGVQDETPGGGEEAEQKVGSPPDRRVAEATACCGESQPPATRRPPPLRAEITTENTTEKNPLSRLRTFPRPRDDVRSPSPPGPERLTRLLDTWNEHRGALPAVSGLSTARRRALSTLLTDCAGDLELACRLLADATREVAQDAFWRQKRLGFDVLVPGKVLGRAEAWQERSPARARPGSVPAPPSYGVGQRVTYRRERYTVEAVTDSYVDLYDEENGSARILFASTDIHAVRQVRA